MQSENTNKSALVQALEALPRPLHEVDAATFIGPRGKSLGTIKMRHAMKDEADRAIASAYRYVKEMAGDVEETKHDPDLLDDAKSIHILHVVCRDAEKPDIFPAFLSPDWMRQHLSSDQLAVLLNLYNGITRLDSPLKSELPTEQVEVVAKLCADMADTDAPNELLAQYPRELICELVVRVSILLAEARAHTAS